MSFQQPTFSERLCDALCCHLLFGFLYKRYVESLDWRGDEKVLDFGCGSGAASKHIAPILWKGGGELTCLDKSAVWIEIAKQRLRYYPHITFKVGDLRQTDLDKEWFDVVFIHFMLHDVKQPQRPALIKALAQTLKPEGRLHIREPIKSSHGMTAAEIRQLMAEQGLQEMTGNFSKLFLVGPMFAGVFQKKE